MARRRQALRKGGLQKQQLCAIIYPRFIEAAAVWRRLASQRISYHAVSGNVEGSRKVILDPHPDSDQHQNLITSREWPLFYLVEYWRDLEMWVRGRPLVDIFDPWSTSVNAFVSYPAHRMTDRRTNSNDRITSALAELIMRMYNT